MFFLTAQWITSRSFFPQWEDSWKQLGRGFPMARAAAEARLGTAALLDSMALTTTISRDLGLELGVQVVLGARLAEEELLAQQGQASQDQVTRQVEKENISPCSRLTFPHGIGPWVLTLSKKWNLALIYWHMGPKLNSPNISLSTGLQCPMVDMRRPPNA